ncbi:CPBP family intramembrane metalloprotease, partial [bacterium]
VRRSLSETRTSLGSDPGEPAFLRVVIARELGEKPSAADLKGARAVPSDLRPAAELATTDRPDRAQIERLAPRADGKDSNGERFSARLAAAQARERAGLPRAEARQGLVRPGYLARMALFVAGLLGASALSLMLWVWYGIGRGNGTFRPQGLPSLPMTPAEADRFALRAAGMFASFLAGSALIGLALGSLKSAGGRVLDPASLVAQIGLLGGIALYALRLPTDPKAPHLSRLGLELNGADLGRRVAWGVAAAFANVPILLIVTLVSSLILKYAPSPSHPSTDALTHNPALGTVVMTFFLASICAPIWEETMFRGLLFQGLVGARFRPVAGALLSSFLFAAIHPQGWAAWPGLMTVALMSCALLTQTRSLV